MADVITVILDSGIFQGFPRLNSLLMLLNDWYELPYLDVGRYAQLSETTGTSSVETPESTAWSAT